MVDFDGLGDAVLHATRAKHLKGMQHDDSAAQVRQRNGLRCIDPFRNDQLVSHFECIRHKFLLRSKLRINWLHEAKKAPVWRFFMRENSL